MIADRPSTAPVVVTSRFHYSTRQPVGSSRRSCDLVRAALKTCHDLLWERSDAGESGLTRKVLGIYASLDEAGRAAFFDGLIADFSLDSSTLQGAAEAYARNPCGETAAALQHAAEPPRRELFLKLSGTPGATGTLVRMRGHLHDQPVWAPIERDLTHVLRGLFNRSVLEFQQIDLETPWPVLERLIEGEAVHPVNNWREMGRRLEADRRCFAFFHPAWPQEPLIFTEVALTRGIPSVIQPIIDPDSEVVDPRTCDTAAFYSISNCQPGLRKFSFGNALINRALAQMRVEMPWLRHYVTISPIPGFRSWLSAAVGSFEPSPDKLLALCAHYLLHAKRRGEPADAVARFHLGNGARLHRINPSSDLSAAGIHGSAGFTVNYVYEPNNLERNALAYRRSQEVRAGADLRRLAGLAAPLLANASRVV